MHGQGLFRTILLHSPHPCGLCTGAAKHKDVQERPPPSSLSFGDGLPARQGISKAIREIRRLMRRFFYLFPNYFSPNSQEFPICLKCTFWQFGYGQHFDKYGVLASFLSLISNIKIVGRKPHRDARPTQAPCRKECKMITPHNELPPML